MQLHTETFIEQSTNDIINLYSQNERNTICMYLDHKHKTDQCTYNKLA